MPPPLMRLSLWRRDNGRLAAIIVVAFTICGGFVSWAYWVQVWVVWIQRLLLDHTVLTGDIALLSKL